MSDATTWTSLLLDKQRMQAAADEAAERMKYTQMRDMLNTGLSAASTIKGAMDEAKLDDIANSLMNANENIPRAQAVDPSKQAAADAKAARMPGFHTGGVAEMKLDAMMKDQKLRGIRTVLQQDQAASLDASRQQQDLRERQEARTAFDNGSKKLRETTLDANATYKNLSVMAKALPNAHTREEYDSILQQMAAMVSGAQAVGLPVQMPRTAAFVPPVQRTGSAIASAADVMRGDGLASTPDFGRDGNPWPARNPAPASGAPTATNAKGERVILQGGQWIPLR